MGEYIKKPIIIEAYQISNIYDHENYAFNLWMDIIKDIKSQYSNYIYNQNQYINVECNNYKIKSRLDCSGYVYACISCFFKKNYTGNTSSLASEELNGFTKYKFTSFNDLNEGDIIVAPGQHTEIFALKDGNKFKSYSIGKNGIKNKGYGDSNINYNWTTVFKPDFNINNDDTPKWVKDAILNNDIIIEEDHIKVKSLEGIMEGNIDDYVIKGIKDELYICEHNIFEETYDEVK